MTAWQKFLNKIIPDPKAQKELQILFGFALMPIQPDANSSIESAGTRS